MVKSKLKRRLRKKFHLGEFQEFGFGISVNFKTGMNEIQFDKFWVEFINEIEKNDLGGGGGNLEYWEFFVTSKHKIKSPTEKDRMKIKNLLETYTEIKNYQVGEFTEAWNC